MGIQCTLSILQSVPVAGPLAVSPIKAGVSLVQIITGLAVAVICGVGSGIARAMNQRSTSHELLSVAKEGFEHAKRGVKHLAYAAANMATFGIFGACTQWPALVQDPIYIPEVDWLRW